MKGLIFLFFTIFWLSAYGQERVPIPIDSIPKTVPKIAYSDFWNDSIFVNLTLPGVVNTFGTTDMAGKMIRALRYENITDAVEDRWDLPRYFLLTVVMQESSGIEQLPNARHDGGIGVIHMQPSMAHKFGLHTFENDSAEKSFVYGEALADSLEKYKYDINGVIALDNRFNHLLNIDAAGRMFAYYMALPPLYKKTPLQSAVYRYAGRTHYKTYWANICLFAQYLQNEEYRRELDSCFCALNPDASTRDSICLSLPIYLSLYQERNENFGLDEYRELPKYAITHAERSKKELSTIAHSRKVFRKPCE